MQKIFEKLTHPLIFILAAGVLRLITHGLIPNFAPITAMALFGGAYLGKKSSLVLPLATMVLTDVFIGFDNLTSRVTVYGTFALISLIGMWLANHRTFQNIVLAAFGSSVLFFLITNFGVWVFGTIYPKTFVGLAACFTAAIPFFRNTLMGDLFYTGVFFGGYELVKAFSVEKKLAFVNVKEGKNG